MTSVCLIVYTMYKYMHAPVCILSAHTEYYVCTCIVYPFVIPLPPSLPLSPVGTEQCFSWGGGRGPVNQVPGLVKQDWWHQAS